MRLYFFCEAKSQGQITQQTFRCTDKKKSIWCNISVLQKDNRTRVARTCQRELLHHLMFLLCMRVYSWMPAFVCMRMWNAGDMSCARLCVCVRVSVCLSVCVGGVSCLFAWQVSEWASERVCVLPSAAPVVSCLFWNSFMLRAAVRFTRPLTRTCGVQASTFGARQNASTLVVNHCNMSVRQFSLTQSRAASTNSKQVVQQPSVDDSVVDDSECERVLPPFQFRMVAN